MQILQEEAGRVIHLVRKNLLKTYISLELNKRQTELKRKLHGTKKVPPVKINLNCDEYLLQELADRKKQIISVRDMLEDNFSYLEIYYEDFFDYSAGDGKTINSEVLDEVYLFLNIDSKQYQLTTNLEKTNPNCLRDLIENYDEVYKYLDLNGWGYLFNEGDISGPKIYDSKMRSEIRAGELLLQDGELIKALKVFKEAYHHYPDNKATVKYLANILTRMGLNEQALQVYQIYLQQFPNDREIINLFSQSHF